MKTPETLEFNIVEMAWSRKKRNLASVSAFFICIILSAVVVIIFETRLAALIAFIPFALVTYIISRQALKLKKIGFTIWKNEDILLVNEVANLERKISTDSINKIFTRGGAGKDLKGSLHRKTLLIDIHLKDEELVTVHI